MLTAITVILAIAGLYIPLLGGVIVFLWPVPITVLVIRHGLRLGLLATVATAIILGILTGPLQVLTVIFGFGLVGLTTGFTIQRGLAPYKIILIGALASGISLLVSFGVSIFIMGFNPIETLIKSFRESVPAVISMYKSLGMGTEQLTEFESQMSTFADMMLKLLPTAFIMGTVIVSFVNFSVARQVLGKMGQKIAGLPPFRFWRFPKIFVFIYLLAMGLNYYANLKGMEGLALVGLNATMVFTYVYFIQGLAVAVFFADKWSIAKGIRVIIFLMLFFFPFLVQVTMIVGLFDGVFNYRRLGVKG
jgi:uncharacterized protein YybS (DUF2232 family)